MDDTKVLIALIAGSITALGWLITHVLTVVRENTKSTREALLNHTERQLESLYGPLAFLIIEGKQTLKDLLDKLGRDYVFYANEPLPEEELKTWLFWSENYFLPRNEQIKKLLMANTHLIEDDEMPESYITFLNHCNSWALAHSRWKTEQIEYSWHSSIAWPEDFSSEVLATFRLLQNRHASLIKKLGND